ncbi:MAG: FAD-dependent oxidoreductase [Rhodomicrobiaceae bacterium]
MAPIHRRHFLKLGLAASLLTALPARLGAAIRRGTSQVLGDASNLLQVPVHKHLIVEKSDESELFAVLRRELKSAASEKRPVAVSAARHSMGGQSLPANGTAITLENPVLDIDSAAKQCRMSAGARWHQVIRHLDKSGFSPAVMQSNSDFGVGSTFCVNAHGWPVPYGPFGSTVRSIRLMLHDGTILRCSRAENAELFKLSMGGYGLFGIILDLDVDIVANQFLKPTVVTMPAENFADYFVKQANDPAVSMAYGRLEIARKTFFREAVAVSYRAAPEPEEGLPSVEDGGVMSFLSRKVYRAQIGSEWAKRQRWRIESSIAPKLTSGAATRNTLMAEPVANLAGRDKDRTDILHEYFVPPEGLAAFVAACREIIPRSPLEFLNITLRYVDADQDSVMTFAPSLRIAGVMSFSQRRNHEGDEDEMRRVTQALIDAAQQAGGSFYLPYRLHATREQLMQTYPRTGHFVSRKRHYDPGLVFRNIMWDTYFAEG